MNSETVHLIATDPPFKKGRDFYATPDSLTAGAKFQDRWSWDEDVHPEWIDKITDDFPKVMNVINGSRESYGDDMGAFLCFMAVRLLEMRRVLRKDGSIYLHCDPTASHYLKELLDAIFGRENFKNEIVWKRAAGRAKGSQHEPRTFGSDHDIILFYSKNSEYNFNSAYESMTEKELEKKFPHRDERGRYNTEVPIFRSASMGARPNLCYTYKGVTNPHPFGWRLSKERLQEMDMNNEIIWREGKSPLRKKYADTYRGKPIGDVWDDLPNVSTGKEYRGYPTQKPLELYEQIIKASSNENDVVLDPFCGCATTCVAAERLNRQWIGIDIWDEAHNEVINRLREDGRVAGPKAHKNDVLANAGIQITYTKKPFKRTDGGSEAVPFFETRMKQFDDSERDPFSNQEKKCMLLEQYGPCCQGCGIELHERYLELDHREPRSDGGSNLLRNRILLCGPCNKLKRNFYTISWLRKENKKLGYMINENALTSLK